MRQQQIVAAQRAVSGEFDTLAGRGDWFPGSSLDPKWSIYQGTTSVDVTVDDGEATVEIPAGGVGGQLWYQDSRGPLIYQLIAGNCEMVATMRVQNASGSGTPPLSMFRLAGIAAHDPSRTLLNYVHAALGSTNQATLRCEHKSTVDSVSEPAGGISPGYTSIAWPSGEGQIRILRVGQLFTISVRAARGDAWTDVAAVDRTPAPLPTTLQWGMMVYSSESTHDVRGVFERIDFRTP